jgi:hypothetical protein
VAVDFGDGGFDIGDVLLGEGLVEADETAVLAACVFDVGRLAIEASLDRILTADISPAHGKKKWTKLIANLDLSP